MLIYFKYLNFYFTLYSFLDKSEDGLREHSKKNIVTMEKPNINELSALKGSVNRRTRQLRMEMVKIFDEIFFNINSQK